MLRGKTILYVEDNLANVALMRELCAMDEVELLVAGTAELGLQLARSNPPDLIAMDINLPGLSGLQALQALRADPATATIPVMAVTAAAQPCDREAGAGFDAYLTKPIQIDLFLSTAERLIQSRR
jgi:CheY-like chemotaxis protein